MPLTEISTIFLKHGYFQDFSVLFQLFFSALDCDQIQIMLYCFACQQGHFWSSILLIYSNNSHRRTLHSEQQKAAGIFVCWSCCQHTFFSLLHSTLNYNSTQMLAKSPARMSLRYSLTELISFFFFFSIVTSMII